LKCKTAKIQMYLLTTVTSHLLIECWVIKKKNKINRNNTSLAGIYVDKKYRNIFMLYLIKCE